MMQISQFGLGLIKRRESCSFLPYKDTNARWTQGWGHLLLPFELVGGEPVSMAPWTQEKCDAQLMADAQAAVEAINKHVLVDLSQPQFDALASLVFNIGGGNFATSTALAELNRGRYQNASKAILMWDDHGHATERRAEERAIFLYGTL